MRLPVMPPVSPMLAKLVREVPEGPFLYEPKWDGFRAIVFRDGDELEIGSRNERPLTRYFPDLVRPLLEQLPSRCVVDGEIVIVTEHGLDFDRLSLRIHPAASRVAKLAKETPAAFVAFDLLALDDRDLRAEPFSVRHAALADVLARAEAPLLLTPSTTDPAVARDWFERFEGAGFDGVVAKPLDAPYAEGERVMQKVKHERTADCVVAGYRVHKDGRGVGSLLLGLYDDAGVLHHVGVAASMAAPLRARLLDDVAAHRVDDVSEHPWAAWGGAEPTGTRLPGAPSRWNGDKDLSWVPLRPDLVAEVRYEHLQGSGVHGAGRFRHTARFVRWRPERDPASCTYAQLDEAPPADLLSVLGG